MATERPLREVISDLLATVECDAVTMHVRDAWAPHLQYRLFCMQGVQDRARMFAGIRLDNPKSPSAPPR